MEDPQVVQFRNVTSLFQDLIYLKFIWRIFEDSVAPKVTLMELLALISLRHAGQLMQPPLPAVAADVRDGRQLQRLSFDDG